MGMRMIDLFSGIGGFSLAACWVWGDDLDILTFCEIEKFPRRVLAKNFPGVPIHDDIHTLDGNQYANVDILTAGIPCQPYSVAGKQRGNDDDRALWPETLRFIKGARPRWVIVENVTGIIKLALDGVLSDLENEGYTCRTFVIPAAAKGAPHRRDRVWIVGHSEGNDKQRNRLSGHDEKQAGRPNSGGDVTDSNFQRRDHEQEENGVCGENESTNIRTWKQNWFQAATEFCRVDDGVPNRVDRLKGLGNAIVPQVAAEIMRAIKKVDEATI